MCIREGVQEFRSSGGNAEDGAQNTEYFAILVAAPTAASELPNF
jgi:hypothetical protein